MIIETWLGYLGYLRKIQEDFDDIKAASVHLFCLQDSQSEVRCSSYQEKQNTHDNQCHAVSFGLQH
jgi:hypothetical protein